jgi:hypothetical protein
MGFSMKKTKWMMTWGHQITPKLGLSTDEKTQLELGE